MTNAHSKIELNNTNVIYKTFDKGFYISDISLAYINDEIICINAKQQSKTLKDKLYIYGKLLNVSKHAIEAFVEINLAIDNADNLTIDKFKFIKNFCEQYSLSKTTCIRALDELNKKLIIAITIDSIVLYKDCFVAQDLSKSKCIMMFL